MSEKIYLTIQQGLCFLFKNHNAVNDTSVNNFSKILNNMI